MTTSQNILPNQTQQPQFHSDSSDEEHAHDEGSYESAGSEPLSPTACDSENYEVLQLLQSLGEDTRNNMGGPAHNGTNSMHNDRRTSTATWEIGQVRSQRQRSGVNAKDRSRVQWANGVLLFTNPAEHMSNAAPTDVRSNPVQGKQAQQ